MWKTFFTTVPGIVISLGAILAVVVTGFLYLVGVYSKQNRDRKDEENKSDDRLINLLKGTVDELEKKVNKQTLDIQNLTKKVEELERDNKKYIEIFQGRDKETQDFYKAAYGAIATVQQTHDILTTVAESIKNTNSAMEKLIELIGKGLDVVKVTAVK